MISFISKKVEKLIQKHDETDPFSLCKSLDILVLFEDLSSKIKGYFFVQSRIEIIVINANLPEELQRIICAHELGHAILHQELASDNPLADFALFDITSQPEFEANIFAAELLIEDQAVVSLLKQNLSFFEVASTLAVPVELLDFKVRVLKTKGYKLNSPLSSRGDFLKKF